MKRSEGECYNFNRFRLYSRDRRQLMFKKCSVSIDSKECLEFYSKVLSLGQAKFK